MTVKKWLVSALRVTTYLVLSRHIVTFVTNCLPPGALPGILAVGVGCCAAKGPGAVVGHKPARSRKLYVLQDVLLSL